MRFSADTARPVAWKNGGGLTRELALHEDGGKMVWRLSLADIAQSGPFSPFPGLSRIHTVVAGAGHRLTGDGVSLAAQPMQPLAFDGGLALDCQLRDGPCRAFNVIYDPRATRAQASVLRGGNWVGESGPQALFVAAGSLVLDGIGGFACGEGLVLDSAARGRISADGVVISVRFCPVRD